jgi:replicative DNA helicase
MNGEQIGMRHAADLSYAIGTPITHDKIRKGALTETDLRHLAAVEEQAALLPLDFVEIGQCDIRRVISTVGRLQLKWQRQGKKLEVVFIDYLQRLRASDGRGRDIPERPKAMAVISKACVHIASHFGVAVIGLSQLSRAVEERKDKRPQMNDLRESGDLEQDADSVTLLYREEYYVELDKPRHKGPGDKEYIAWEEELAAVRGKIELIGAKNRHGKPRTRTVQFNGPHFAVRSGDYNEHLGSMFEPEEDLFNQAGAY